MLNSLHQGKHDKYFSLANTAVRSAARLAYNLMIAQLGGADVYATFVLLITLEVIWGTLVNAYWITPMLNIAPGQPKAIRDGLLFRILKRVTLQGIGVSFVLLLVWAIAFRDQLDGYTAIGFVSACGLGLVCQTVRSWRNLSFSSWHAFWADGLALPLPLVITLLLWTRDQIDSQQVLPIFWLSLAGSSVLATAIMLGIDVRRLLQSPAPEPALLKRLRTTGRPILWGSIAYSAGSRLQPMVLAATTLPIQVSRFGAATALVGPVRMLAMALTGVIRPRLAVHYQAGNQRKAQQTVALANAGVFILAILLLIVFAVAGDRIGIMVFGAWFEEARALLLIAGFYAWIACVSGFFVTAVQTQSDLGSRLTARWRTIGALLSLSLMWPACYWLGALGAIVAMAACEALIAVVIGATWWRRGLIKQMN